MTTTSNTPPSARAMELAEKVFEEIGSAWRTSKLPAAARVIDAALTENDELVLNAGLDFTKQHFADKDRITDLESALAAAQREREEARAEVERLKAKFNEEYAWATGLLANNTAANERIAVLEGEVERLRSNSKALTAAWNRLVNNSGTTDQTPRGFWEVPACNALEVSQIIAALANTPASVASPAPDPRDAEIERLRGALDTIRGNCKIRLDWDGCRSFEVNWLRAILRLATEALAALVAQQGEQAKGENDE